LPRQTYESDADIVSRFEAIGRLVREHDVRATFHPGQFCSLSSDSPSTVRQAVAELDHHAWQFDCMGLPATPFHAINIHGGKSDRSDNLKHVVNTQLSSTARARLTFENDESCYSVADLLDIWKSTGVPVLFDSHHHTFNDAGLPMDLASRAAKATWGDVRPLQHISNSEPTLAPNASFTKLRAHSEYIHHIPQVQLDDVRAGAIDLEVEAKLKNLAIDRMIQSFDFVSKSTHSVMNTTPGVQ
jgi:UV DNA damage endonuclease